MKKIPEADLLRVASEYGCAKLEDLYADLGYGKFSARQILSNALGEPLGEKPEQAEEAPARLLRIGEAGSLARPALMKWSRKEILGHLIDSASNNHQRFVRGRIAIMIWLPGAALVVLLATWIQSLVVGVAGIALGIVLLGGLAFSLLKGFAGVAPSSANLQGGAPPAVGLELFSQYILPFELAAVLLLVALLGALLLARHPKLKVDEQA